MGFILIIVSINLSQVVNNQYFYFIIKIYSIAWFSQYYY
jgi:hypothetical protein